LTFRESVDLYLKPQDSEYTTVHFLMVYLDACVSIMFLFGIVFHIIEDKFTTVNDKIIESIIGIGLSTMLVLYSFTEGCRFLQSKLDRMMYLVSCLMMKPILIPMIFPNRFRSTEATEEFSE
jgi:hypothetical protein